MNGTNPAQIRRALLTSYLLRLHKSGEYQNQERLVELQETIGKFDKAAGDALEYVRRELNSPSGGSDSGASSLPLTCHHRPSTELERGRA
jgi:hypothetical protein